MRVRTGFVSNSSTTSFCIYGISFDLEDISPENLKERAKNDSKIGLFFVNNGVLEQDDDNWAYCEALADTLGLEYHCDGEAEYYCIGRSWTDIGDNETGAQFKKDVEDKIKLISDTHPEIIAHAFYC